jgi:hypothetical protein
VKIPNRPAAVSLFNYELKKNGETTLLPLGNREGVSSISKSEDLPKYKNLLPWEEGEFKAFGKIKLETKKARCFGGLLEFIPNVIFGECFKLCIRRIWLMS